MPGLGTRRRAGPFRSGRFVTWRLATCAWQTLTSGVARLLDRNYAEPLDVPSMAEAASMSPSHFSADFAKRMGRFLQLPDDEADRAGPGPASPGASVAEACVAISCSRLVRSARVSRDGQHRPVEVPSARPSRFARRAALRRPRLPAPPPQSPEGGVRSVTIRGCRAGSEEAGRRSPWVGLAHAHCRFHHVHTTSPTPTPLSTSAPGAPSD